MDLIKNVDVPNNMLNYHILDIDTCYPNSRNPNVQTPEEFYALKQSIKGTDGNEAQPILVRKIGTDKYEIVD